MNIEKLTAALKQLEAGVKKVSDQRMSNQYDPLIGGLNAAIREARVAAGIAVEAPVPVQGMVMAQAAPAQVAPAAPQSVPVSAFNPEASAPLVISPEAQEPVLRIPITEAPATKSFGEQLKEAAGTSQDAWQ